MGCEVGFVVVLWGWVLCTLLYRFLMLIAWFYNILIRVEKEQPVSSVHSMELSVGAMQLKKKRVLWSLLASTLFSEIDCWFPNPDCKQAKPGETTKVGMEPCQHRIDTQKDCQLNGLWQSQGRIPGDVVIGTKCFSDAERALKLLNSSSMWLLVTSQTPVRSDPKDSTLRGYDSVDLWRQREMEVLSRTIFIILLRRI